MITCNNRWVTKKTTAKHGPSFYSEIFKKTIYWWSRWPIYSQFQQCRNCFIDRNCGWRSAVKTQFTKFPKVFLFFSSSEFIVYFWQTGFIELNLRCVTCLTKCSHEILFILCHCSETMNDIKENIKKRQIIHKWNSPHRTIKMTTV